MSVDRITTRLRAGGGAYIRPANNTGVQRRAHQGAPRHVGRRSGVYLRGKPRQAKRRGWAAPRDMLAGTPQPSANLHEDPTEHVPARAITPVAPEAVIRRMLD